MVIGCSRLRDADGDSCRESDDCITEWCFGCILEALEEAHDRADTLRDAVNPVRVAFAAWLDANECDCDETHICGLPARRRELVALDAALAPPMDAV